MALKFWRLWPPPEFDPPQERLVETSAGPAVIRLGLVSGALTVTVKTFGSDGWETRTRGWFESRNGERSVLLSTFLAQELPLPTVEADALAQAIQGPWVEEWERFGAKRYSAMLSRFAVAVMTALALLVALAVIGVVLLAWALAS